MTAPAFAPPQVNQERASCNPQTAGISRSGYLAILAASVFILPFLSSAGAQEALGDLDQFQLVGENNTTAIHSNRSAGQTWTVGLPGRLSSIELGLAGQVAQGGELRIDILDANAGYDPLMVLGTVLLTASDFGPSPVDLVEDQITATLIRLETLDIMVQPGDVLGLRMTTDLVLPALFTARWLRDTTAGADPYPDGDQFINGAATGADLVFKTFVQDPDKIFANGFE